MTDLPEPMTPPDCDLRGMPYMPVDVVRLFDSDMYALSTGDEFKAAFTLWGRAFLQVPAGSVPDDDRILAHLSGAGPRWPKLKAMALRGWIKCSDGRLYHPVVAEKAATAWAARQAQRSRTVAARSAKAAKNRSSQTCDNPPDPSATTSVTEPVASSATDDVTGSKLSKVKGREEKKEKEAPAGVCVRDTPREETHTPATRLPIDWMPSVADENFARSLGLDVPLVLAKFRDHYRAAGTEKVDWAAQFRLWCRGDAERAKRRPALGQARPGKLGWLIEDMRAEGSA